ncbi:MAG: zinc-dependent alcohol dehydrogenase family protein [Bacteroidota bacterium]|nr:zinc-dependent alcohol dehydrogenase family protein [Bacteroidota bacterium]
MKAVQFSNPGPIEYNPLKIYEVDVPSPSNSEILVKIKVCGICHTDLHVIEGELPQKKSPLTPGHQIIGIVEKVGSKVTNHKVGDRVGVAWLNRICGECEFCECGKENLCTNAKFTGYDVDGGFAEYVAVHESFAYPIPQIFSDEAAAPLLCAGIIGFRSLRLSNIKPGERLGLFGFGASAHITIQVARHWGCDVYVFSRNEHHRKLAEQLGAVWTGTADQIPPHLLHSAISFAPSGELVPKALGVLRRGGTLALAGIYVTQIPSFDYSLLYHERKLCSVANSTRQDSIDFLKIAAEIPVRTEIEVFPLADANYTLQLLKESKIHGAGILKI